MHEEGGKSMSYDELVNKRGSVYRPAKTSSNMNFVSKNNGMPVSTQEQYGFDGFNDGGKLQDGVQSMVEKLLLLDMTEGMLLLMVVHLFGLLLVLETPL